MENGRRQLWARLALQHAARRLDPGDEVVLLAVCPQASEGYLECGRMVLEAAHRACAGVLAEKKVRTRLAVGDAGMVVPALAAEERANLVVMGPPDFHDLRHTSATRLLKEGIHPKVVGERLGHSDIRLTLETYSHVLPGMQEEAARRVDSVLKLGGG